MKRMLPGVLLLLLSAPLIPAQDGYQKVYIYGTAGNATGLLEYVCIGTPTITTGTITAASNAAAAVLTVTAHGFNSDSSPEITIRGFTGNWAAANGSRIITVTGANTFSIPVNSGAFGALAGSPTFYTQAPRQNQAVWKITKYIYDANGNLTSELAARGDTNKCSDRAAYSYQ